MSWLSNNSSCRQSRDLLVVSLPRRQRSWREGCPLTEDNWEGEMGKTEWEEIARVGEKKTYARGINDALAGAESDANNECVEWEGRRHYIGALLMHAT